MKLSIGLPVRNGELFLEAAIESILAQTYPDFELIISDNASTDRTLEICHSYDDPRIRIERQESNRGAAWNFNNVFHVAKGEYFKWAAHDDLIAPDFLQECMRGLEQDPTAVLCYTGLQTIDVKGNYLDNFSVTTKTSSPEVHVRFREMIIKQHPCHHVFGIFRSDALRRSRLIGNYMASDRVMLAQLSLFGPFREVDRPLFFWRRHPGQSILFMKTPQAYTRWFDPNAKGRFFFPNWRILKEYHRVVSQADIATSDRRRCQFWLWVWPLRYAPWLAADIVRSGKSAEGGSLT